MSGRYCLNLKKRKIEKKMKILTKFFCLSLTISILLSGCSEKASVPFISKIEQKEITELADTYLEEPPITVTASKSERSSGGLNDFYSEGDYWWPDSLNPGGPYIQKDGQSNPDNFSDHRHAMVRLSEHTAVLTSAWLLTNDKRYAGKAVQHLEAWFVAPATRLNPHMLYAQAIWGRHTGRGIGLIDAYHLVEVARSAQILLQNGMISQQMEEPLLGWFSEFQKWMTTHQYGIDEMNAKNNHGTTWVATAAAMASLTGNSELLQFCSNRFETVLLPSQMDTDGSFPLELRRTKPYAYALFNMDAMSIVAQILSTPDNDLWAFETADGKSLKKGMEFIFPYIQNKSSWPYAKDIYIWEEWPVRQPCLLFAGMAYDREEYINTYMQKLARPSHPEVVRNLPVRHPVIWLVSKPV
jgi:hypothetical protein